MARPPKCRRVCRTPLVLEFTPIQGDTYEPILLTVDEYEAVRLIDYLGLSQEQCSERMQIARTTAQKIYENARLKLSQVLVEGRPLRIEGGSFRICDPQDSPCGDESCVRKQFAENHDLFKGDNIMRIAVTYENGNIFQHFGHTESFKVYDVEDGKVISSQVVSTNGSGHGALAQVLNALQADILICGGIGGGAQMALASVGIQLFGGVSGNADAAVEALLSGNLAYNPNVQCNHHGEHHHEEGHQCGSHGCGGHH